MIDPQLILDMHGEIVVENFAGTQGLNRKTIKFRARAVRRSPL